MYSIADLYDLNYTLAADYLKQFTYPWEALKGIKDFILELGRRSTLTSTRSAKKACGYTRLLRFSLQHTSVRLVLSDQTPKSVIVLSYEVRH